MKNFRVAVFEHIRPGRKSFFLAYLRDYNPTWEGCCMHIISAETGSKAKQLAMQEHRRNCGKKDN